MNRMTAKYFDNPEDESMKKMNLCLLAICLIFCIAACQPTPESPAAQRSRNY